MPGLSSEIALRLSIATVVFLVALDGGSYAVGSRLTLAILFAWGVGLAVALGLLPAAPVPRAAVAALVLLACFAGWTLASASWAASDERAVSEFNRVALYLAVAAATVVAARRASAAVWSDGLAAGIVGVCLLALASRYLRDLFGDEPLGAFFTDFPRLSYPVNYWNGLAILCALAVPLCLRVAVSATGRFVAAAAVAALPAIGAVVYLASSRGGALTALVGATVFLALADRRYAAATALACGAAGAAVVVAGLTRWDALVDDPGAAAAVVEGRRAAALTVLACAGSAALFGLLRLVALRPPPRALGYALVGVVVVVAAGGAVASDPRDRFEAFKAPPEPGANVQEHLLSGSSTGRWQHWEAAVDQFREDPLRGEGAGSYAAWWARHGTVHGFVSEAHSLFLETLGELGLVGFALLVAVFAVALGTGALRALRGGEELRAPVAALAAAFAAYAVAAGIDWMWELTVVSFVGMAVLGLLVGPASTVEPGRAPPPPLVVRVAVPVLALGVMAPLSLALLGDTALRESLDVAARGRTDSAVSAALRARSLEPWAASPPLQLALVFEAAGEPAAARRWIDEAIERDPLDWRIRLAAARIAVRAGEPSEAAAQLDRAVELNPRSPLFAGLPGAAG